MDRFARGVDELDGEVGKGFGGILKGGSYQREHIVRTLVIAALASSQGALSMLGCLRGEALRK